MLVNSETHTLAMSICNSHSIFSLHRPKRMLSWENGRMGFSDFFALAVACAFGVLAMYLGDNQFAREHQWLIPILWGGCVVALLFGFLRTPWFRALISSDESLSQRAIKQRTEGPASHAIAATHGSVVNIYNSAPPASEVVKRPRISIARYGHASQAEQIISGPREFLSVTNHGHDVARDVQVLDLRIGNWIIPFDVIPLLNPTQTLDANVRPIKKVTGYTDGVPDIERAQNIDEAWRRELKDKGVLDFGPLPIYVSYSDYKGTPFRTICSVQRDVLNRSGQILVISGCEDTDVPPVPPLGGPH